MKRFFAAALLLLCLLLVSCAAPHTKIVEIDLLADPTTGAAQAPTDAVRQIEADPEPGAFNDPGCPVVPDIPACWTGVDPYRIVYVSRRSHTVHDSPICSGMKHYTPMQAYEAYDCGYKRCNVCW